MSHWFTVETKFKSEQAIRKAAKSMRYPLLHKKPCRGYNEQTKIGDLVLHLPGEYDLGFEKQADGSFTVFGDFWSDHLSQYLGDPAAIQNAIDNYQKICSEQGELVAEKNLVNAKMARFKQAYNRYAVEELIQKQGLQYVENVLEDGSIMYEVLSE